MDAATYAQVETIMLEMDHRSASDGRLWVFCPSHPDGQKHGNRSLSLHPKYGLTCFAGCEFKTVLEALQARPAENNNRRQDPSNGKLVAIYQYKDASGTIVIAEKARIEYPDGRKKFRWRLPGGTWDAGLGNLKLRDIPLYGVEVLVKTKAEEPVYFVEGEKAQLALALQGILAVTHGGGASTRDFGDSLQVLQSRTVLLWPDNDAAGREYITIVQARLRGIAQRVRVVTSPIALPEKGDAYDYFNLGGTPDALQDALKGSAAITEPVVEVTGEDALTVTMPTVSGPVQFALTAIDIGARRFDAEMEISFTTQEEPYGERVNLLSSSQRTELRRELESLYGKGWDWPRLLNRAFGLARSFYGNADRSLDVADAPSDLPDQFAIDPILPLDSPTILFGDGSASKSTQACALAFAYCTGMPFLGYPTPGRPVIYVDWEDTQEQFYRLIRRIGGAPEILLGRGNLFYWPARGLPLSQLADALKAKARKEGVALIIYDSISGGCDGQPEDSITAKTFMNAVHRIGCTALCIAHITKRGEEDKPFGSVMWHNFARRTWLVKRTDDEDADVLDAALICKKVNHGRRPKSIPVRMKFSDPEGPISVERGEFDPSSDLSKAAAGVNSRIKQALLRLPMNRAELAQFLDVDEGVIRTTMGRHKAEYFNRADGKWGVATQ